MLGFSVCFSHLTTVSVRKIVLGKYAEADFRLLR